MTIVGHFGAIDDQTIRIRNLFFRNRAVEAVEVSEVSKAAEVNESAEVSEAWKIAAENFRVILVLEFNNLRTKMF